MRPDMFRGRCYVCGIPCGHTYCAEHKWMAQHLDMPYRRDTPVPAATEQQITILAEALERAERVIETQASTLDAWRRRNAA